MKLLAALSLLPFLSQAAPAPAPTGAFSSLAIRSASPIMYLPLQARGLKIYLGGNPATYCPLTPKSSCPPGKVTSFIVSDSGGAGMNVEVPGGQEVYVDAHTGALSYAQAHTEGPSDGLYRGFTRTSHKKGVDYTFWSFAGCGATGFVACPVDGQMDHYQVFANIHGHDWSRCLGFDALADAARGKKPAAWQYT